MIDKYMALATAEMLLDTGAVSIAGWAQNEPFTLKNGNKSPIYINCRRLMGFRAQFDTVLAFMQYKVHLRTHDFDTVVGGESAGIPYAIRLAAMLGKPTGYVRKAAKGYGTDQLVEGLIREDTHYLLVEDLITDGGSKLSFINALRSNAMCNVPYCLVLFDRQQGGADELRAQKVELLALCTFTDLMEVIDQKYPHVSASLWDYHKNPKEWHVGRGLTYKE